MKAKKIFGQNFLKDKNILERIVSLGDSNDKNPILEIGPGLGDSTSALLQKNNVIAVEKDSDLIPILKKKFAEEMVDLFPDTAHISSKNSDFQQADSSTETKNGKLILVQKDILDFNPQDAGLISGQYKIIANIPYYLTGKIIRLALEKWPTPKKIILLVQKEVAERITAKDGKESLLSISVKKFGKPKKEFIVKAGSFSPKPKVDSAVISISEIRKTGSTEIFFSLIKIGFAHKRKTLFGNLKNKFTEEKIAESFKICNLETKIRPEKLSVSDWDCLNENLNK